VLLYVQVCKPRKVDIGMEADARNEVDREKEAASRLDVIGRRIHVAMPARGWSQSELSSDA
jgi:hypothetical protein